ncbi:CotH kinase family protein [Cellulosilyticum ruminicola]|uniref:CotH kinase family protein n=1 Tax=Cellulosilyticum ruminicola TaxID=425254 RepID=UPI0006D0DA78|nr:CotH kinase family protein [Cellulosilyticum ruminicola]
MINSKYVPHLAAIVMAFVIAIVAVGIKINPTSDKQSTITQPEYMSKVFDKDKVLQINIQIDESKWEELKENALAEQYYPADLTVNGETYKNIGIRAKGNSSLSMVVSDDTTDRYSFKIKVNEYQEQNIYGLEKFVLNNMIGDATYMKEYIAYDMYKEMGVATPGYAFANITINGQSWGVYLAVESLEESFVERNFGDLDGNLYKVETTGGMGGFPRGKPDGMSAVSEGKSNGDMGNKPDMPNREKTQGDKLNGEVPQGDKGGSSLQQTSVKLSQDNEVMKELSTDGVKENVDKTQELNKEQDQQRDQSDNKDMMKFPGGMGASGGANLVYKDDEISSYSSIFNYTILKKTTQKDYAKVIESIKNLKEGTNLEEFIDVGEVLKYCAINTFLVNLDSYAGSMKHNFYLYEEDGKLQILPWDYNLAFGGFMMSDSSRVINFPIDEPVTDTMENSPLIAKLLEVDAYKEMYHEYLQELVETYVTSGKYEETISKIDALIGEYVKEDATAFYTYEEYKASLKELKQYGIDRTTSIVAQLSGEQPSTEYGSIATSMNLKAMGQQGGAGGLGELGGDKGKEGKQDKDLDKMFNMDLDVMMQAMEIVGEAASVEELTDAQKAQITVLGMDDAIQSIFDMKKKFEKMGLGFPRGKEDSKLSKADKIMAAIVSIILIFGVGVAFMPNRRRYYK